MFKNYLRVARRNILKHKAISLINIAGLSLSVALALLLFLYVRREQSFDTFHAKGDRLYRLEMTDLLARILTDKPKTGSVFSFLTKSDDQNHELVFPLVVAASLQQTFPEIGSITRTTGGGETLVRVGNQVFSEKQVLYADSNFFENFSFGLSGASAHSALLSKNNAVLSAAAAKRYFGNDNPIGKTLSFTDDTADLYTVSAVTPDPPGNSSIQYGIVVPAISKPGFEDDIKEGFNHANFLYFLELRPGVDKAAFGRKLNNWAQGYYASYVKGWGDSTGFSWYLRPFPDCHYNVSGSGYGGWHYTNAKNLYELSCLVLVILLIASLNYVLLTVSGAAARSQEVGVRKAMGARKGSIVLQFWVETQVIVCIAVALGLGCAWLLIPGFNRMMGTAFSMSDFSLAEVGTAALILCLVLGVLAGYYPALLLSRMKTLSVMKSFGTFKVNPRFSRLVVVVQYTACVVLMMAAFVIARQMRYINDKDLGFDKDQVLLVDLPWELFRDTTLSARLAAFARTEPSIIEFSGMNGGLTGSANNNGFKLNGEQQWRRAIDVDYDYFHLLGLKLVQGRLFSRDYPTDTIEKPRRVVVNETLFRMLGKTAKIGEYNEPIYAVIIGVVKDYHIMSLTSKILPEEHRLAAKTQFTLMYKLRAGQTRHAIDRLQAAWKSASGNYPFSYRFLDDAITAMYTAQTQWEHIILLSCLFAVFIACMGLFGLSAINAANRTKEIGIRKVLGAGVKDIVALLSWNFLGMVLISLIIALPLSWWMMNHWLEDFAYRIDIAWWMPALVGLAAAMIALVTVSVQSFRAATANPVDSLHAD